MTVEHKPKTHLPKHLFASLKNSLLIRLLTAGRRLEEKEYRPFATSRVAGILSRPTLRICRETESILSPITPHVKKFTPLWLLPLFFIGIIINPRLAVGPTYMESYEFLILAMSVSWALMLTVKNAPIRWTRLDTFITFFMVAVLLSFINTPSITESIRAFYWLTLAVLLYFIVVNNTSHLDDFIPYHTALFISSTIMAIIGIINFLFEGPHRIDTILDPVITGDYLLMSMLITSALLTQTSPKKKTTLYSGYLIQIAALILTGTRMAIFVGGLALILIMRLKKITQKRVTIMLSSLIIFAIATSIILSIIPAAMLPSTLKTLINPTQRTANIPSLNGRFDAWAITSQIISQPIIGHGFGPQSFVKAEGALRQMPENITALSPQYRYYIWFDHPHDIFLSVFFDTGIIGLLLFLLILREITKQTAVGLKAHVDARSNAVILGAGLAVGVYFTHGLVDLVLYRRELTFLLFYAFAVIRCSAHLSHADTS
ncbi:O-Antigen ligase [uncultured archaeon]|nr:O-Antigen ligase [uncultured archaeon]